MKRIIVIFIIVCCLLSCVEVSCLAQGIYGEGWDTLSDFEKELYLLGIMDGLVKCIKDFYFSPTGYYIAGLGDQEERRILTASISNSNDLLGLISSNYKVIINIMNDLYKDPANANIDLGDMCFLACRKLKGESIESSLRELREKTLEREIRYKREK